MSAEFFPHMLTQEIEHTDTLYVANRDLDIVYVNDGWANFASENKGHELLEKGWNENLLANLSGKQRDRWRHIYRLLLAGRLPHHQEQMNCSSPTERRIYELRITPQHDEQGEVAWLIHHNVRIDNMPDAVDRVSRQLERIDQRERNWTKSSSAASSSARSGSRASTWLATSSRSKRSGATWCGTGSTPTASAT